MKIVSLTDVPKNTALMEGAKGAWRQVPLGSADGTPNYSFRVFTLEPNGHTPYHVHDWEHLNYIIAGEGVLMDPAGEGHRLRTGDFALVPGGEKHQYRNLSSTESFVMICAVPKEYE